MEVYILLYRYMPLYVFSILRLKHMNISVIVPLESAVSCEGQVESHVKITYQSNLMWLGASQPTKESISQGSGAVPDEARIVSIVERHN